MSNPNINFNDTLDHNNMKKAWKSAKEKKNEAFERARLREVSQPEPIRSFPGSIRPSKVSRG